MMGDARVRPLALLIIALGAACSGGAADGEGHQDDEHKARHGGEPGAGGVVKISAAAVARTPIRVVAVAREAMRGGVEVPAEIELNPDRVAHVTPLAEGQVAAVSVVLGDEVVKGQVLATLRSVALGEARSELARAKTAVQVAEANYQRQETLQREGIGAQKALVEARGELERARASLAAARARLGVYGAGGTSGASVAIKSPLDGVVIERHATPGEVADPEKPLFVVADTRRVWVTGRVYEQDVALIRRGADATIALEAFRGRSWTGTVSYVATVLDDATRTLGIRVELDNPDGVLRPGMFGVIRLAAEGEAGAPVPVVPETAVQKVDERDVVFVPGDQAGEYRVIPVELGERADGRVVVRSGVKAGDPVVAEGAFVLKSELLKDEMGDGHAH
jgi:membrane fusion protein, heavy metal efflux system